MVPYPTVYYILRCLRQKQKNTRGVDATPSLGAYVTRFSLRIVGLKPTFKYKCEAPIMGVWFPNGVQEQSPWSGGQRGEAP